MPFYAMGPSTLPKEPIIQTVPPHLLQSMSNHLENVPSVSPLELSNRIPSNTRSETGDRRNQSSTAAQYPEIPIRSAIDSGSIDTKFGEGHTEPDINDTETANSWEPLSNRESGKGVTIPSLPEPITGHGGALDQSVVPGYETPNQAQHEPNTSKSATSPLTQYLEQQASGKRQAQLDRSGNHTRPNISSWLEEWKSRQQRDQSDVDEKQATLTEDPDVPTFDNDRGASATLSENHLEAGTEVDDSDSDEGPRSKVLSRIQNRRKVFRLKKFQERAALIAAKGEAIKGLGQLNSPHDDTSKTFEDPVSVPIPADISPVCAITAPMDKIHQASPAKIALLGSFPKGTRAGI
jgi:hypothetical protein